MDRRYDEIVPFRRMLVALAGRESDDGLLAYAATLRRILRGVQVQCIHVVSGATPAGAYRQRIPAQLPGATFELIEGDLLDALIDAAAERGADLILLGHGHRGRRRLLARRLAMKAPCSIWMVPDSSPATITRILAPVDFSQRSADTLDTATAIAEAAGQDECIALHVYFNRAAATFDEFDEVLMEDEGRAFNIFVAPINLHGVWAKPLFVESARVAPAILRTAEAERSDLIVMGTRGRSTSAAVLLGSETEEVLIETPVPILVVKHFGVRLRLLRALRDERLRQRSDERYT